MASKEKKTCVEDPLPLFGQRQDDPNSDTKPQLGAGDGRKPDGVKADPHNLMLLYDLFFAANLTAFSNIHETTNGQRLVAYIGYFLVLWLLWFNVMLFDVRFVVDSIAERILRAIHLGAMVGVSVVAPQYDPADQVKGTFQAFSVILMASRVVLAVQYGLTTLRKPDQRKGLAIMSATNGAAALVYLGITFRFTDSTNSRVFVAWYILGFVETFVVFLVSYKIKGLEFLTTVLPERMKMATLLILGEGVIVVAEHVSTVVKNANSWTSETVGVLTATVALIYVIFQIYFDWSWPASGFRSRHPLFLYIWSVLHLFFHISLVLIMEGATQFVVWWKIVEMINFVSDEFLHAYNVAIADGASSIAADLVARLTTTIDSIWVHYPPNLLVTIHHKEELLEQLLAIDDSHWNSFPSAAEMEAGAATDHRYQAFVNIFRDLKVTVLNSILQGFNIEEIEDSGWQDHPSTYEQHAYEEASERFSLVYIYVFCFAGAALIIMSSLHILSRINTRSTQMQRITIGVNSILGMGLMLLASMSRFESHSKFAMTPWIIPSLFLVYLCALILVHIARTHGREEEGKRRGIEAESGPTPKHQVAETVSTPVV